MKRKIKPGVKFAVVYEVTRPAEHGEKWMAVNGKAFKLRNLRRNLWFARIAGDPSSKELLVCLDDLNDKHFEVVNLLE